MIVYCDGKFVDSKDANISIFDHGFLYGDGVFEGIRAYNGRVFKLKEHIDRLYESANAILLKIEVSRQEMTDIVLETIRRNKMTDSYIRLIVSRGVGDLGLNPTKCPHSGIYCIAGTITLFPQETYDNGLEVVTVSTRRNSSTSLSPRIKSLNYLNNILAKIEANRAGVMEAIMLNQEGYVCEGTGDNIFIVKDGVVKTPPIYAGFLKASPVIRYLMSPARKAFRRWKNCLHSMMFIPRDECFLTGTAAELIPVVVVDSRILADGKPGPVFKQLLTKFRDLTKVDGELI
jgi:branched-chain amino acid aminotransferase